MINGVNSGVNIPQAHTAHGAQTPAGTARPQARENVPASADSVELSSGKEDKKGVFSDLKDKIADKASDMIWNGLNALPYVAMGASST